MKITIDFYRLYEEDSKQLEVELPDDTMFCKLHWSKFGKVLNKYKGTYKGRDYTDDMLCYDVYCYTHEILDADALEDTIDDLYPGRCDVVLLGDAGTLIRLYNCDILNFDNFISLDDFNKHIDFTNEYYECYKDFTIPNNLIDSFSDYRNGKDIDINDLIKKFEDFKKSSVVSYFKIIKLDEDGLYIRDVYLRSIMHQDVECNNIIHETIPISCLKDNDISKLHYDYKGIILKDAFDKRIQKIINLK